MEFRTGSGIATLAPALSENEGEDLAFESSHDENETLALLTLRRLLDDVEAEAGLPVPVVEALDVARKAMGEDGCFGVELDAQSSRSRRVVIDAERMRRLQPPEPDTGERTVTVIGRLHLIEADQPYRRVGVRAQDGIDWACTYPDELHPVVTKLIERLVRVTGEGRRLTTKTGKLRIAHLDPIPEHTTDPLFTEAPLSFDQLRADQHIAGPQGLASLVDDEWVDDDEGCRFLEATLSETLPS